jgi:hypothetical protein
LTQYPASAAKLDSNLICRLLLRPLDNPLKANRRHALFCPTKVNFENYPRARFHSPCHLEARATAPDIQQPPLNNLGRFSPSWNP